MYNKSSCNRVKCTKKSKQTEQLQQVVERDCKNNELLCYHALEVERQTIQLNKVTKCIRVLQGMGKSSGQ